VISYLFRSYQTFTEDSWRYLMTEKSDLNQTLQRPHSNLQESNFVLEVLWTRIVNMEADVRRLDRTITELEQSVNSLNPRSSRGASGYLQLFLNLTFGGHAANLLNAALCRIILA
jgi:hypothetical protein